MATAYVVLAHTNYPNAFNVPYPVAVFDRRKFANDFANKKNESTARLSYYVRSAKKEPKP